MMVTDVFVAGARKGWNICTTSTIPNILMAFVIMKALQITGALDLIGTAFSPVMGVFGLPGAAATALLGGWLSTGGGIGVIVMLFDSGAINGSHVAILAPALCLMDLKFNILAVSWGCRNRRAFDSRDDGYFNH